MSLNENSSRRKILEYIEIFPYNFLINFSDEPWAQPYIDEAAKIVVNESSLYFLRNLSHKPWAQPYIDEAAKDAVKVNPINFLNYFSSKPWAELYIDEAAKEAAKKDPKYYLKHLVDRFPQGINLALFALGGKNVSK